MDNIRNDVIAKQKQRQAVYQAMQSGLRADWDYNPPLYQKNMSAIIWMDRSAAKTRFPPLEQINPALLMKSQQKHR